MLPTFYLTLIWAIALLVASVLACADVDVREIDRVSNI